MMVLYDYTGPEKQKLYRRNIYVGAVIIRTSSIWTARKILFQTTYSIEKAYNVDLLYDSPNYLVSTNVFGYGMDKIFIGRTVNLTPALETLGFPFELTDNDIRRIYKLFLHSKSDFLKYEDASSPLSKRDYKVLRKLSILEKQPSEFEKQEYPNKFKTKVKTYTFK